jgi:soluble P-type ATPase
MVKIEIPGMEVLEIEHLVLDYNGTIAINGVVIDGVMERLEKLSVLLDIHVITADTYGSVHEQCHGQNLSVHVIGKYNQNREKLTFLESLKPEHCVVIGNGKNDLLILSQAALGFAVIQEEGISTQTLFASDIVFQTINDALEALLNPNRLIATLRN